MSDGLGMPFDEVFRLRHSASLSQGLFVQESCLHEQSAENLFFKGPSHYRFFAVEFGLREDDLEMRRVGKPYTRLLEDMLATTAPKHFGLRPASDNVVYTRGRPWLALEVGARLRRAGLHRWRQRGWA